MKQSFEEFIEAFSKNFEEIIETHQRPHDRMDSVVYWSAIFVVSIAAFTICALELLAVIHMFRSVFGV